MQISYGFKSDYSALICEILPHRVCRGKGTWKLNAQILFEKDYCDKINTCITKCRKLTKHLNPSEAWEIMKLNIIETSKEYSQDRAKTKRLIISQLEEKIESWHAKLNEGELSEGEQKLYDRTVADYEGHIEEKMKGAIFRSKSRWYNLAEINSKYFFGLERTRGSGRGMSLLIKDDGSETTKSYEKTGRIKKILQ